MIECERTASCEPGDHTFSWPCEYAPGTGTLSHPRETLVDMGYIVGWTEPQGPERYTWQEVQEASSPRAAALIEAKASTPWPVTVHPTQEGAEAELDQIKANARLCYEMGYGRGKYQGD